jgi:hypothetical protein
MQIKQVEMLSDEAYMGNTREAVVRQVNLTINRICRSR